MENIITNNGVQIALAGILVVFVGLVLISFVISLFNRVFTAGRKETETPSEEPADMTRKKKKISLLSKEIPEEEIAAIGTALELYRKLHFEELPGSVTFRRGQDASPWKAGGRFGQRTITSR